MVEGERAAEVSEETQTKTVRHRPSAKCCHARESEGRGKDSLIQVLHWQPARPRTDRGGALFWQLQCPDTMAVFNLGAQTAA